MPSPDLSPYVDLTLFDKDTQDIFQGALDDLQTRLPDWTPREGNTEVLLMESLALEVSEGIFAINRLPGAVVEVLLLLYGIQRDPGAAPIATVTFTLADTVGHTIPAGTRVRQDLGPGFAPITWVTDSELTVARGQKVGTITVTGDRFTDDPNGVTPGGFLELLDGIAFVESVILASIPLAGRDPESDNAYLSRGIARFQRLTDTLVLPDHFVQAALETPGVFRARAIDNYNSDVGGGVAAVGTHAGHITVVVYGEKDVPLSTSAKNAIDLDFESRALANLSIHIANPTVTAVPVTTTVRRNSSVTDAQAVANVTGALQEYLNTDTWLWDSVVRRNELIALISNAPGIEYVQTLDAPANDINLTGVANLVRAGAINVTVTAP